MAERIGNRRSLYALPLALCVLLLAGVSVAEYRYRQRWSDAALMNEIGTFVKSGGKETGVIRFGLRAAPHLIPLLKEPGLQGPAAWALKWISGLPSRPMEGWDVPYTGIDLKRFYLFQAISAVETMSHLSLKYERNAVGKDDYDDELVGILLLACAERLNRKD